MPTESCSFQKQLVDSKRMSEMPVTTSSLSAEQPCSVSALLIRGPLNGQKVNILFQRRSTAYSRIASRQLCARSERRSANMLALTRTDNTKKCAATFWLSVTVLHKSAPDQVEKGIFVLPIPMADSAQHITRRCTDQLLSSHCNPFIRLLPA